MSTIIIISHPTPPPTNDVVTPTADSPDKYTHPDGTTLAVSSNSNKVETIQILEKMLAHLRSDG